MSVCTRFAPSPTGVLHIGSVRTALFSWLYARKEKGCFILRIEDTDLERSTQASVDAILDGMNWLGLEYDQGPFYQTQRFDRYAQMLEQLLTSGHAYRCYCSKERLEKLREEQQATQKKPRYDGYCRHHIPLDPYASSVIRFRTPHEGAVSFDDVVHGTITISNSELDDLVLARPDGSPTYNFTVVIDDMDMKVTHVLRGDDHINNTPRQIHLFRAFNIEPPIYGHIPMILGPDGKRLSKRSGAVGVQEFREDGILPHALLNYLARLGWSHGDQEIFSLEEMIQYFDIHNLNHSAAALNPEKLLWLNQHYLKTLPPENLTTELQWQFYRLGVKTSDSPALTAIIVAQRERVKTLKEMAEKSAFWYSDCVSVPSELWQKHFTDELAVPWQVLLQKLEQLSVWSTESIHAVVNEVATAHDLKLGKLAQPIRIAATGTTISPPIDMTLALLGKTKSLQRLKQASV